MEVSLFPNPRRPGIGLKPRREAQRPLLPQHARHCPVLEAGNTLGFLVHPPLNEKESFSVGYEGEGRYQFVYSVNPSGGEWEAVFSVVFALPVGSIGATREEVTMLAAAPESRDLALMMTRMFIVPDDLGTPAGAVTLRGAWNFQTPPGWDTVYTPIFNMIERPVAPMLVIRVETDWFVHDTEFRYVLQPGETISASHSLPIGQVFFVPREEITLRDGTEEQIAARRLSNETFFREKMAAKRKTSYGMEFSPHYSRMSRRQSASTATEADEVDTGEASQPAAGAPQPDSGTPQAAASIPQRAAVAPPRPLPAYRPAMVPSRPPETSASRKVGRNDQCPCGSGRKYKKCHGEGA